MNLPRFTYAIALELILLASLTHATQQQASCTFETFSVPAGYTLSQVNGVSDDGTVLGQLVDNQTLETVGFMRSASGVFTEYAAPKAINTWLNGSNATGDNAGFYQDSAYPGHIHGMLLKGSTMTVIDYPKVANTWLFDVNKLGASVGSFSASASVIKGFVLENGKYTTIAYPNELTTYPMAIDDNGDVVGTYASTPVSSGFLWKDGTFTTINYPHASYGTVLTGVNDSGVIVGNHMGPDNAFGFIYENKVFKNIVYSGGKYTEANGINNNGLISGQIFFKQTVSVGYTATCE